MHTTIIIPARLGSTRLPEKALSLLQDKPLIQWVYEACQKIELADDVIIATDHEKIFDKARSFGAAVQMTSTEHLSGTDRCAEVALGLETEFIVNVQGDEPFVNPKDVDRLIKYAQADLKSKIITLYHRIHERGEIEATSNVKLVLNRKNKVLYFSRSPIPFERTQKAYPYLKHIGIYGFRKSTLLQLSKLPASDLELTEGLEQLRWLDNGYDVFGVEVESASLGIDTEEDLLKAEDLLKSQSK